MTERTKPPTKEELKQAEQAGGSDYADGNIYMRNDQLNYCDKGGHRARSEANQPQHSDHWKKQ